MDLTFATSIDFQAIERNRFPSQVSQLFDLVRAATLAASGHNTQPWKFAIKESTIEIHPDYSRRSSRSRTLDRPGLWVGKYARLVLNPTDLKTVVEYVDRGNLSQFAAKALSTDRGSNSARAVPEGDRSRQCAATIANSLWLCEPNAAVSAPSGSASTHLNTRRWIVKTLIIYYSFLKSSQVPQILVVGLKRSPVEQEIEREHITSSQPSYRSMGRSVA